MAYDWTGAAEGGNAEKMHPGYHYARVDRVIMGKKSGAFKSRNGDPQIMVIFNDDLDGGEASTMLTLSDKAAWTVARLLSRLGVDLEQMKRDNVEPRHFANEKLAQSYFVGKSCWIKVEPDGEYQKVTPLKNEEVPEEFTKSKELVDDPANPFA
jgi:hypothetical protein